MLSEAGVAVVTGGGRGIGRGITLALAQLGYAVVVNYRADGRAAEATCGDALSRGARRAIPLCADIADLAQGHRLLDETLATLGRVNLWINNAAIAPAKRLDLLETTPESWDQVLGTDLRGPFFLTQAVARAMMDLRAAGTVADARIIFITSISSRFASVTRGEYCVAKAGLSMVAQLFAARLAGEGLGAVALRPGLIENDMRRPEREQDHPRNSRGL